MASSESSDLHDLLSRAREAERFGQAPDARALFEQILWRLKEAPGVATPAALLRWVGSSYRAEGHSTAALDCYTASLAAAEAAGNQADIAAAYNWMGVLELERGHTSEAVAWFEKARGRASKARDRRLTALVRSNLGSALCIQGELTRGLQHFRRSLECYRSLGDEPATARGLNNLGLVQVDLARWAEAEQTFSEAAAICDRTGDLHTRAMVEINRIGLAIKRADYQRALRLCEYARMLASRIDYKLALGEIYKAYGIVYRELGKPTLAESHLEAALEVARRYENLLLEGEVHRELALLYRMQERNHAALQSLNTAHSIFSELRARPMLHDINAQIHNLESIFLDVVSHWSDSIERKDRYTRGHCERVADYAGTLARAVGYDEKTLFWFRMGALLHDVGKTAVPEEILNKSGPLNATEWQIMRHHTLAGEELLSSMEFPWDIKPMVRSHHERWDGTGYPDGLAADNIPLAARILCVADVFDALTTDRSYRAGYKPEEAIAIMRQDAGRVFDSELLQRFADELGKLSVNGHAVGVPGAEARSARVDSL